MDNAKEFNKMYEWEVLPILEEFEEKRKKRIKKICLNVFNIIIIFALILLFDVFCELEELLFILFVSTNLIASGGLIYFVFVAPDQARKFKSELKENLFPVLLKKFGNIVRIKESSKNKLFSMFKEKISKFFNDINKIENNEEKNEKPLLFTKKELKNSGLFAPFDICRIDDAFVGTHKNTPFKFAEVQLVDIIPNRYKDHVRFKGIVLSFKTGKMAENQTIIATKGSNIETNEYEILFVHALIPCIVLIIAIVSMAVSMCANMGIAGLIPPAFLSIFLFMLIFAMIQCQAKM